MNISVWMNTDQDFTLIKKGILMIVAKYTTIWLGYIYVYSW